MMKRNGFTLVELVVTLAVVAILLTVGIPSMRDLIRNARLTATSNMWVASLNIARSEAIKEGRNATLCVSDDGLTCSGADWRLGWLAWIDIDADGNLDSPDEIIRVVEQRAASLSIASAQSSFRISPQGDISNPNTTLDICDDRTAETGRQLRLLATGGVSLNSQYGGCS